MILKKNQSLVNNPHDVHPNFVNQTSYFSYIFRIQFIYDKIINKIIQDNNFGINPDQLPVLFVIKKVPNITQQGIAKSLSRDKASITRTIRSLVQKGYISCQLCKTDNRKNIITLTDRGHDLCEIVRIVMTDIEMSLHSESINNDPLNYSENFNNLELLCQQMLSHLENDTKLID